MELLMGPGQTQQNRPPSRQHCWPLALVGAVPPPQHISVECVSRPEALTSRFTQNPSSGTHLQLLLQ